MRRLLQKRSRRVILGALVVFYLSMITFGGCADRLLLIPSTGPRDAGRAQRFFLDDQNRKLEIFTARSPAAATGEPDAFVLEFCGNATRAEDITAYVADRWSKHPVEAWVMNYPGYGQSEGGAHLKLIPSAALATFDALAAKANGRPIFLAGNSMGTAPALHVAANRKVSGLILQNSPPLRAVILKRHGWWNLWLLAGPVAMQLPAELDSIANGRRVTAPAVFLVAENDSLVPPKYQQLIIDGYAGEKHIIRMPGINHYQSITGESERKLLDGIDWLFFMAQPGLPDSPSPRRSPP